MRENLTYGLRWQWMENPNGHEAGNGGYSQRDTSCNSPFFDPTLLRWILAICERGEETSDSV